MGSEPYRRFFYAGLETGQSTNAENEKVEHLEVFNTWYQSLSFEEQTCFVFKTIPSQLTVIFWSHTLEDIKVKTKLVLGFQTVAMTQEYVTLLNAAGAIFGKESPKENKKGRIPKDEAEAMAMAASVFG